MKIILGGLALCLLYPNRKIETAPQSVIKDYAICACVVDGANVILFITDTDIEYMPAYAV